ncbi:MAG: prepilin peptidase [Rhodospirillales bacterium]
MPDFITRDMLVLVFAVLLITAAVWDALSYRIPNFLSVSLLVLFPVYAWISPVPVHWSLLISLGVLAAGMYCFIQGWMGGGDVKLLPVVALWAGPDEVVATFFIIGIAGGLLALAMKTPARAIFGLAAGPRPETLSPAHGVVLPYGIAIACGGLFLAWRLTGAAY